VAGVRYGGAVLGAVLVGIVALAAIPTTAHLLRDGRVLLDGPAMAFRVLVDIPLGTVLLEELAFRGTLFGLLRDRWDARVAVVASSLIFGLWHVAGVVGGAGGASAAQVALAVAGTLVATTVAGLGFAWLRVRSQSLVAPVLAHIATNSLTFAAAWFVSR
jgi:membrane protease YdiL (CAAX protease family)